MTETVNILDGSKKNNWFRPADVCVAPDGSLFVTDWYDPGVGGHAQRDLDRRRPGLLVPAGASRRVQLRPLADGELEQLDAQGHLLIDRLSQYRAAASGQQQADGEDGAHAAGARFVSHIRLRATLSRTPGSGCNGRSTGCRR